MYIDKNRAGRCRISHRFAGVLCAAAVLFSVSGCGRYGVNADAAGDANVSVFPVSVEVSAEASEEIAKEVTTEECFAETDDVYGHCNTGDIFTTKPSYSDANYEMCMRLNENYGVNICYGDDVCWTYSVGGEGITDEALIGERLALVEECLKMYPVELFAKLKEQSPVTINLVDGLNGADGYTDARTSGSISIALSCGNSAAYFKLAFHHEMFHFMEYCMLHHFGENDLPLLLTDSINDAMLYGTDGHIGTIYDDNADIYHQYFTSVYAKSNAMEDRAELFSYYMGITCKECMKSDDSPITRKMKLIASSIRIYCPALSSYPDGSLMWERMIAY